MIKTGNSGDRKRGLKTSKIKKPGQESLDHILKICTAHFKMFTITFLFQNEFM